MLIHVYETLMVSALTYGNELELQKNDVKFEDIVTTKSDNISRATSRVPLGTEDELSSTEFQVHSHKHYHNY